MPMRKIQRLSSPGLVAWVASMPKRMRLLLVLPIGCWVLLLSVKTSGASSKIDPVLRWPRGLSRMKRSKSVRLRNVEIRVVCRPVWGTVVKRLVFIIPCKIVRLITVPGLWRIVLIRRRTETLSILPTCRRKKTRFVSRLSKW